MNGREREMVSSVCLAFACSSWVKKQAALGMYVEGFNSVKVEKKEGRRVKIEK
jgi:hypothetical protein